MAVCGQQVSSSGCSVVSDAGLHRPPRWSQQPSDVQLLNHRGLRWFDVGLDLVVVV